MAIDPNLAGIGAGLSSFADTYMKAKQQQDTNDLNQQYVNIAKQREKAGLLAQGMELDENGNPQYNATTQALRENQQKLGLAKSDLDLKDLDPTSSNSKLTENFYRQRLEKAYPGSGQFVPSGQSAQFYDQKFGEYVPEQEKFASNEKVAKTKSDEFLQGLGVRNQYQQALEESKEKARSAENDKKYSAMQDQFSQKLKQQQDENDKKYAAQEKMLQEKLAAKGPKQNPAYQSLDKDFAKDWNAYTNGGRASIDENIDRLEQAKQYLQDNPDSTGSYKGLIPDSVRSMTNPDLVQQKQNVQASVIGGLKSAMGGRVTQNELNFFTNLAWNDKLPAKDNIEKIDQVINKIKSEREATERKGQFFEKNGTLQGMQQSQPTGYTPRQSQGLLKNSSAPQAAPASQQKSSGSQALQPGVVVNGMVFKGGNYKDKNNWLPVQKAGQ